MATVGLIGIGRLGSAIAARLLTAGFELIGSDTDSDACSQFEAEGGRALTTYELALSSRRILLCLPNHEVVLTVLPWLRPGTIVIDTTNASPEQSETAAAALKSRGIAYLDCAVCDWHETVRARGGKVVCGGENSAIAACTDILASFANPLIHAGPSGAGTRMKRELEQQAAAQRQSPTATKQPQ